MVRDVFQTDEEVVHLQPALVGVEQVGSVVDVVRDVGLKLLRS